ncbi:MAG: 1-acyl-sn-glycerol-3-phosphate acyltransferase [Bacteroidia bacterium]|nr:1-acyl-sn-glycerol-3-phosphate acyltransferase [Bacteroidia bacterium]
MNIFKAIARSLWKLLFVLNFVTGLLVLYPLFYILLSREAWFPMALTLKRFWARWILIVPGIFVSIIEDKAKIKTIPKPCIYCANHSSYLDIVISYIILPDYFVFMGKAELLKAPLFSIFFTRGMNIAVERKSRIGSHQAFLQAAKEIDKGHSMFMFPEGTLSSNGQLKGFKNGAFKLALDKQLPIVPITFTNNWKLLQNGGFFKALGGPGIAKVIIHEPISTKGYTDTDLVYLLNKTHDAIASGLTPPLSKGEGGNKD